MRGTRGEGLRHETLVARREVTGRLVWRVWAHGCAVVALTMGCADGPLDQIAGVDKTAALERAERRLFDGAPPVIPHVPFGMACVACHNRDGVAVPDVGFAPASPHVETAGMSGASHCQQCHVWRGTDEVFSANEFVALRQDLRTGRRLNTLAPPVVPHAVFMRENCIACHSGAAAREEIRTSHPERVRCRQCHLEQRTAGEFGG